MKHPLRIFSAVAIISLGRQVAAGDTRMPARPNILYIMSDDHAAHAIGAYGGRLAKLNPTPVLDQLAREGAVFTNAFCTNSICTPSRASIMTGQYSHRNSVLTLEHSLPPERHLLAIEMRRAGFQTAMIGKWHLGAEPNFEYYKVLPGQGLYFDPVFNEKSSGAWPENTVRNTGHVTDVITDHAIAWLRQRDRSRPFFLMLHHKAPHDMFEYAPRYQQYLKDIDVPEPESLWRQPRFGSIATRGDQDELLGYLGSSIGPRSRIRSYVNNNRWGSGAPPEATHQAYNEYMKRYLRCVKGIDDSLGRVFEFLKDEGIFDSTVIVYTSDQGMMLGEHDYQDKRWMYEESLRMPLIIRYPRTIRAGWRTDAIVENVDFAPTLLDFAGASSPVEMQGRSFRAICETDREPVGWKQSSYYRYWMHFAHHQNPSHIGLRTKRHKIIFYYGCDVKGQNRTPPGWELYDLEKDPQELVNVIDDPAYREVVRNLKQQLQRRRQEIGDTDDAYPEIQGVFREFWDWDQKAQARAVEISHAARQRYEDDARKKAAGKKKRE